MTGAPLQVQQKSIATDARQKRLIIMYQEVRRLRNVATFPRNR